MKCRIYLQDDMMNHITGPVNQHIKMDKWFHKVMHLWIWCGETRTHSDISHIREKKKVAIWRSTQELSLMIGSLKTSTFFYGGLELHLGLRRHLAVTGNLLAASSPNQQLQTQLGPYTRKPSPRAPAASAGKAGSHCDVWRLDRTARATNYSHLRLVGFFVFF